MLGPDWLIFSATTIVVLVFLEVGFRLGRTSRRRSPHEKESPAGTFAAAMLGLVAFMLGFTFSLASDRYQTRKQKLREEVDALQIAFLRADALPEPDRRAAKTAIASYVSEVARAPEGHWADRAAQDSAFQLEDPWHGALWEPAIAFARDNPDSNIAALYVEAINTVFAIRTESAMLAKAERVRAPIWVVLYGLTVLAVLSVAYQTGIAGSKRAKSGVFLAVAFALVLAMIADLDRVGGLIHVSQQPFEQLDHSLETLLHAR